MTGPSQRRAARVLLLDREGRILLQQCRDPLAPADGPWWNTPGGGLDDGETPAQAAARELFEETGLQVGADDLGPVVHERVAEFDFLGAAYRQVEDYFLVRTDPFDAEPTAHSDAEMMTVLGTRWWTREELRGTRERVFPGELLDVLDRLDA